MSEQRTGAIPSIKEIQPSSFEIRPFKLEEGPLLENLMAKTPDLCETEISPEEVKEFTKDQDLHAVVVNGKPVVGVYFYDPEAEQYNVTYVINETIPNTPPGVVGTCREWSLMFDPDVDFPDMQEALSAVVDKHLSSDATLVEYVVHGTKPVWGELKLAAENVPYNFMGANGTREQEMNDLYVFTRESNQSS